MKKIRIKFLACLLALAAACAAGCSTGPREQTLNDNTYFLVMQSMLFNPEAYLQDSFLLDCFVYEIEDVKTKELRVCGVRKCPANIGCKCGNDSILGFVLDYDGEIPAARNQTENNSDKTWIRVKGKLAGTDLTGVTVYSYDAEGKPTDRTEIIYFCTLDVESLEEIDGTNLKYYVD